MAGAHSLQGLMKYLTRDAWRDRFVEIYDDHLIPACDRTGIDVDEVISILHRDWFMSTVWGSAFEDFLTRECDGQNIVDDYLKRRGWKESASNREYMSALRNSVISLYEVSDIIYDTSFKARDLVRGSDPVLISERSATHSLKQWDRIATRVVQLGSRTHISGAILPFERDASEKVLKLIRDAAKRAGRKKHKLADLIGRPAHDDEIANALTDTEILRAAAPAITTIWLVDIIDRATNPQMPAVHNAEGDELMFCTLHFPFAADATSNRISSTLGQSPELHQESPTFWNWIETRRSGGVSVKTKQSKQRQLQFFTTNLDTGALVLGTLKIKKKAVVLTVNSRSRSDRGRALISEVLGALVGQPFVEIQTLEKIMADRDGPATPSLDLSEEHRHTIIHDSLNRHYRDMLDQPIQMLGNKSPREAAKTTKGRAKVIDWLKVLENHSAKLTGRNDPMATYDFSWLWAELGVNELRR
jgi:hypothetical protein